MVVEGKHARVIQIPTALSRCISLAFRVSISYDMTFYCDFGTKPQEFFLVTLERSQSFTGSFVYHQNNDDKTQLNLMCGLDPLKEHI